MKIVKITYKTKCDFPGCRNISSCMVTDERDLGKKLNLCEQCVQDIYACIAKTVTPKSIDAPFKNQKKLK